MTSKQKAPLLIMILFLYIHVCIGKRLSDAKREKLSWKLLQNQGGAREAGRIWVLPFDGYVVSADVECGGRELHSCMSCWALARSASATHQLLDANYWWLLATTEHYCGILRHGMLVSMKPNRPKRRWEWKLAALPDEQLSGPSNEFRQALFQIRFEVFSNIHFF